VKTAGVKALIEEVLATLPRPITEDVIEDVFVAIEANAKWLVEYEELVASLGKLSTNSAIGMWVAKSVGRTGAQQVVSTKSKIAGSYSKLEFTGSTSSKKLKVDAASQQVWEYYDQHRNELPKDISRYKAALIDLVMEGIPVHEAFAIVQKTDA